MYYPEDMDDEGVDIDGFKQWLTDYFEKSSTLLHASSLDIYAVLRGQVISTNGMRDESYQYEGQEWYEQAMAAGGEVIFTDAYPSDVYNGQMVITVAVSAAGSDNAVAFDVPVDHFRAEHTVQDLPKGGAY